MKHSHYKKPVRGLEFIDVYRVLELYEVTDPAIAHAIKKLLCPGQRGAKTVEQDVQEAIDTLLRWQEMRAEDGRREKLAEAWGRLAGNRVPEDFDQQNQLEPAAEIDDESERQQRIQQGGEMAEHVYPRVYVSNMCLACGNPEGHGGLMCPTMRATS